MRIVLLLALVASTFAAVPAAADVQPPECPPIVEDCPYMGRQYNVCNVVIVDGFCIWGP